MIENIFKTPTHTPAHLFRAGAIYMITASTYKKIPHMKDDTRKEQWLRTFRKAAETHAWKIIAWVVLDNHYHTILQAPESSAETLPKLVASCHKFTARQWNDEDNQNGRKIWWNYWDTCIRSEKDYLARLNYLHWNPVKHGLVDDPKNYPYSSCHKFFADDLEVTTQFETDTQAHATLEIPDDF